LKPGSDGEAHTLDRTERIGERGTGNTNQENSSVRGRDVHTSGTKGTKDYFPYHDGHVQVILEEEEESAIDKNGNRISISNTNYPVVEVVGGPVLHHVEEISGIFAPRCARLTEQQAERLRQHRMAGGQAQVQGQRERICSGDVQNRLSLHRQ
jgi:hypothetical protein